MTELTLIPLSMPGWPTVPDSNPLVYLALLLGIPLGIGVVVALLVGLPNLARRGRADGDVRAIGPDEEPLWLGANDQADAHQVNAGTEAHVELSESAGTETGGTSARW